MKSENPKAKQLDAVNKRIESVSADICRQMYVDDIREALELAGSSVLRHEVHVLSLNDERAELSFLKLRKVALEAAIEAATKAEA